MIELTDVEKLAKLARIKLTTQELSALQKDMVSILGYVDEIKSASSSLGKEKAPSNRNVFRDDQESHESGVYAEDLLSESPSSEEGYVKVKKIL